MSRLPTIKARALPSIATASATTVAATAKPPPSFHAAIPSHVTNLPAPETAASSSATTASDLGCGAVPRHVPKPAAPEARRAAAAASASNAAAASASNATAAAIASADAIPREVSESATTETRTATATTAGGMIAPVTVPGKVAEVAAVVASSSSGSTSSAGAVAPVASPPSAAEATSTAAEGVLPRLERSAVGAGDVDGLGLVVVAGGDGELDAIAF